MSVHLDEDKFELFGACDKCGAPLCCIMIETGEALCSNEDCGVTEKFDAAKFSQSC